MNCLKVMSFQTKFGLLVEPKKFVQHFFLNVQIDVQDIGSPDTDSYLLMTNS